MTYRIRKSFTFEAAHQLETAVTAACHECIHGHSYKVELVLIADSLNDDRMVLDFAVLSEFKTLMMAQFDHCLLLHENKRKWYRPLIEAGQLKESRVRFFDQNPTAEIFARWIFKCLVEFLDKLQLNGRPRARVFVDKVRVHETETGWAEYKEKRKK